MGMRTKADTGKIYLYNIVNNTTQLQLVNVVIYTRVQRKVGNDKNDSLAKKEVD